MDASKHRLEDAALKDPRTGSCGHAAPASGRARQGNRPAGLCDRCATARNAVRRHCRIARYLAEHRNRSMRARSRTMKGVRRVVRLPDAVAVVADFAGGAPNARSRPAGRLGYPGNEAVSSAGIAGMVRAALDEKRSQVGRADGDVEAGLTTGGSAHRGGLCVPFLAHVTMEPQNCTAHVQGWPS